MFELINFIRLHSSFVTFGFSASYYADYILLQIFWDGHKNYLHPTFDFQIQKSKERERRELGKTLTEQKLKREDEERIKAAEERRKDKVNNTCF